jgi:hypothetical protein
MITVQAASLKKDKIPTKISQNQDKYLCDQIGKKQNKILPKIYKYQRHLFIRISSFEI